MKLDEVIRRELEAALERFISLHETPDETCARVAADLEAATGVEWDVVSPDPWTLNCRPRLPIEQVALTLSVAEAPDAAE